ncbi:MAG TPA: phosphopantetheine-binding protein [Rhizomicrobium sp.]|jgi:acyl carrier protein|nr:phosphopantetheine-binding protein [Rhizomicrobium sp.]
MSNARDRIIAIACRMLTKRGIQTVPGGADNLREAGLTSLDMVNLVLAVEAEFDIEIPQSAMTPENFDTVAAIESLVSVTLKAA